MVALSPPLPTLPPFRENEAMLEARVQDRTQQLADALSEQQLAREQADKANMSKKPTLYCRGQS